MYTHARTNARKHAHTRKHTHNTTHYASTTLVFDNRDQRGNVWNTKNVSKQAVLQ